MSAKYVISYYTLVTAHFIWCNHDMCFISITNLHFPWLKMTRHIINVMIMTLRDICVYSIIIMSNHVFSQHVMFKQAMLTYAAKITKHEAGLLLLWWHAFRQINNTHTIIIFLKCVYVIWYRLKEGLHLSWQQQHIADLLFLIK